MNPAEVTVQLLSPARQQLVIQQTNRLIERAAEVYGLDDQNPAINFSLKGRSAGMYRVRRSGRRWSVIEHREIRYNPYIFAKYFDDNFTTTIPHEVAHYVSDMVYGLQNIKPHGREWHEIMDFFGADARVTANYDLAGIPLRKQTYITYQCACREHRLTSIRHNRIKKYRCQYFCNHCKCELRQKPETPLPG